MENNFQSVEYQNIGERTTVCLIITEQGFEALGSFCCKRELVDDMELRKEKAYDQALRMLDRANQRRNNRREY